MPEEWTRALIIPIYKKGAKEDCNKWSGISLLDIMYEVVEKIIKKMFEEYHNI